jgi:nucleoside diphosphate kinase
MSWMDSQNGFKNGLPWDVDGSLWDIVDVFLATGLQLLFMMIKFLSKRGINIFYQQSKTWSTKSNFMSQTII